MKPPSRQAESCCHVACRCALLPRFSAPLPPPLRHANRTSVDCTLPDGADVPFINPSLPRNQEASHRIPLRDPLSSLCCYSSLLVRHPPPSPSPNSAGPSAGEVQGMESARQLQYSRPAHKIFIWRGAMSTAGRVYGARVGRGGERGRVEGRLLYQAVPTPWG